MTTDHTRKDPRIRVILEPGYPVDPGRRELIPAGARQTYEPPVLMQFGGFRELTRDSGYGRGDITNTHNAAR